jgi:hypothetical protein
MLLGRQDFISGPRSMQSHDDILVIIAKATPEDIHPAAVLGVFLHLNAQADRAMIVEIEFFQGDR